MIENIKDKSPLRFCTTIFSGAIAFIMLLIFLQLEPFINNVDKMVENVGSLNNDIRETAQSIKKLEEFVSTVSKEIPEEYNKITQAFNLETWLKHSKNTEVLLEGILEGIHQLSKNIQDQQNPNVDSENLQPISTTLPTTLPIPP